jgi:hypothetical protein
MINQKNYYTSVSLVAQILILRPESVEGRNAAAVLLSLPPNPKSPMLTISW